MLQNKGGVNYIVTTYHHPRAISIEVVNINAFNRYLSMTESVLMNIGVKVIGQVIFVCHQFGKLTQLSISSISYKVIDI